MMARRWDRLRLLAVLSRCVGLLMAMPLAACGSDPVDLPQQLPDDSTDVFPPGGNLRFDTRAGGAQSIQDASVTTLAQALSVAGLTVYDPGGGTIAFTSDADGAGSNAFRFDWPGVGPTTEIDLSLYRGTGGLGLNNSQEVWLQWKIWQSRTATGGGIGTAGDWDCCSQGPGSGKRLVWFRGSGNNTGRFTFAPGGGGGVGEFFIDSSYNPTYASVSVNWNNYVSQWITLTFRLKPDSGPSANDGIIEVWFNDMKIKSITNADMTHYSFSGELQIGGPTWIGVPQDQTMYIKDIVIWQP